MLPWWVSSCDIDGRTIFLDIKRNRYSVIRSDTARALSVGDRAAVPRNILDQADAFGWLGEHMDRPACPVAQIEKPRIELASIAPTTAPTKSLVASAMACMIMTRCRLATRNLESLLRDVSATNDRAAKARKRASVEDVVLAADVVERFALGSKACLLKSLALQKMLSRHGHASVLVFGVRLNPFGAHCWVQQGDVVLNDTIERVGMFTIIRAVA